MDEWFAQQSRYQSVIEPTLLQSVPYLFFYPESRTVSFNGNSGAIAERDEEFQA